MRETGNEQEKMGRGEEMKITQTKNDNIKNSLMF